MDPSLTLVGIVALFAIHLVRLLIALVLARPGSRVDLDRFQRVMDIVQPKLTRGAAGLTPFLRREGGSPSTNPAASVANLPPPDTPIAPDPSENDDRTS